MQQPGILNVAVNAGFTDADVWAAGPSVIVTFDRKCVSRQTACDVADKMCDEIWAYKDQWSQPMPLDGCIRQLKEVRGAEGTIVVADFSDNPGSGPIAIALRSLRRCFRRV